MLWVYQAELVVAFKTDKLALVLCPISPQTLFLTYTSYVWAELELFVLTLGVRLWTNTLYQLVSPFEPVVNIGTVDDVTEELPKLNLKYPKSPVLPE